MELPYITLSNKLCGEVDTDACAVVELTSLPDGKSYFPIRITMSSIPRIKFDLAAAEQSSIGAYLGHVFGAVKIGRGDYASVSLEGCEQSSFGKALVLTPNERLIAKVMEELHSQCGVPISSLGKGKANGGRISGTRKGK